jgi:hypothetical protein
MTGASSSNNGTSPLKVDWQQRRVPWFMLAFWRRVFGHHLRKWTIQQRDSITALDEVSDKIDQSWGSMS